MEALIIVLAAALVGLSVLFCILLYHQMLLTNNINQRLVLMTKDAMEKVNTQNDEMLAVQDELTRVRLELSTPSATIDGRPNLDEMFDPHGFDPESLEDKD